MFFMRLDDVVHVEATSSHVASEFAVAQTVTGVPLFIHSLRFKGFLHLIGLGETHLL